jgi:hypothetical protein
MADMDQTGQETRDEERSQSTTIIEFLVAVHGNTDASELGCFGSHLIELFKPKILLCTKLYREAS